MKTYFLIVILFLSNCMISQIQFDKLDSDYKIISQLFDAKMIEKDTSFYWFPNSSESVQFDSSKNDTLFTKIDTIFKHDLKKIYLTKTYKSNFICHACQPSLGIIELQYDELNEKYNVLVCNKYVNNYGTWGESPKERYLMQISPDAYASIVVENYSGMGVETKITSIYLNGKKIFSFESFLDESVFEEEKLNSKYKTSISYDKKTNTIKIIKKGKDAIKEVFRNGNEYFEVIPVNQISTYKFDGEFLQKISTKNIITKKK
jgi:hypothetical protein